MAEVLLGVSGGIAAYKAVDVMRILQRRGHGVTVVMTRAARRFVGPATFAALSGRPVGVDLFGAEERPGYDHLELARRADLLLVAPASANTIARMAAGLGDGLLGSVHLAFDGPVVIAPAMNTRMWLHPATADNLALLVARGVQVVAPASGLLADGEVGRRPAGRPGGRSPTRSRPAWRAPAPWRGGGCSSAPAARASRSTRCATSATARAGAWGGRSPRRPGAAAPTSPCWRPTSTCRATPTSATSRRRRPPTCAAPRSTPSARATCWSWPPRSPTSPRPPRARERSTRAPRAASPSSSSRRPTSSPSSPAAATARWSSASPPSTAPRASPARAPSASASSLDLIVHNDVSAGRRRLRQPRQRDHDHRSRRARRRSRA